MSQLPKFAEQWVQQWKQAAPLLQAIRDEELRRLGDGEASKPEPNKAIPLIYERYPERHGMVIMQRWFLRRYLIDQKNVTTHKSDDND